MGISPPSDLIIDVMRQADPVKAREAAERLAAIGRTATRAAGEDFSAYVKRAIDSTKAGSPLKQQTLGQPPFSVSQEAPASVRARERMSASQQLEAFVLSSLIETMMPKDAESVFGSGTAGSFWRSMLAEKLAAELTMAGGVGLSKKLGLNEIDKPKAGEMLGALLHAATSAEVAGEAAQGTGSGVIGGHAMSEPVPAHVEEAYTTQTQDNGA